MASFSEEQFQALLATLKDGGGGGGGGGSIGPGVTKDRPLIAKFIRGDAFNGAQERWADWAFSFKRAVRSQSAAVYRQLIGIEVEEDFDENLSVTSGSQDEQRSGELYDILCQHCTGEALGVIRLVDDMKGFTAWVKLHQKYNPKTMARGVRMLGEVVNPARPKELKDIETAVNRWQDKVNTLRSQFGEGLSERMQLAIFTNMMPAVIQDFIYANIDKGTTYIALRDKVQAMVGNKIAVSMGPAPMDVGQVVDEEDWEVDAVWPTSQCSKCGGYGHFARDCATKGDGKGGGGGKGGSGGKGGGEKGMQKGSGKSGGGKGYFEKGKGKGWQKGGGGKGYQGTCYKCGKVGHKAAECWTASAGAVETEGEEAGEMREVDMGSIWVIGNIEVGEPIKTFNVFKGLEEEVEEEKSMGDLFGDRPEARAEQKGCGGCGGCWAKRRGGRRRGGEVEINAVEEGGGGTWTRLSGMMFNVADVRKPLAAAAKVVAAGNRVVLAPEGSFVENLKTGEKLLLREERGVYVMDVEYESGAVGCITLDSGAGVSVWPKQLGTAGMMPAEKGLRMVAANGTEIRNMGRKLVKFKALGGSGGKGAEDGGGSRLGSSGQQVFSWRS